MPVVHKYFIHHFRLLTKTKMYLMCCTTQPSLKPSNKASLLFCNNWSTPPPCIYTGYLNAEYCFVLPPQFHLLGSPCSLLPSTEVLSNTALPAAPEKWQVTAVVAGFFTLTPAQGLFFRFGDSSPQSLASHLPRLVRGSHAGSAALAVSSWGEECRKMWIPNGHSAWE